MVSNLSSLTIWLAGGQWLAFYNWEYDSCSAVCLSSFHFPSEEIAAPLQGSFIFTGIYCNQAENSIAWEIGIFYYRKQIMLKIGKIVIFNSTCTKI